MPPKPKSRQASGQPKQGTADASIGPSPEQIVTQSYTEIHRLLALEDADEEVNHAGIVKLCDKILKIDPTDTAALHTKATALAKLDNFEDALLAYSALIKAESRDDDSGAYAFERAYSLYRLNRLGEAKDVAEEGLKVTGVDSRDYSQLVQLNAQILYRIEYYGFALELYTQFTATVDEDTPMYEYILANFEAIKAAAILAGVDVPATHLPLSPVPPPPASADSHELAQNRATQLLSLGRHKEALEESERGLAIADANEADASDTAPLRLLQGAAKHVLGDTDGAREAYIGVLKVKSPPELPLLASHNLGLLLLSSLPLEAAKRLGQGSRLSTPSASSGTASTKNPTPDLKLPSWQKSQLDSSTALARAALGGKDARKKVADVAGRRPESVEVAIAQAAVAWAEGGVGKGGKTGKEGKREKALEDVEALAIAHPAHPLPNLTLVHLRVLLSDFSGASEAVEKFIAVNPGVGGHAGVVGLKAWLKEKDGDLEGARKVLEGALDGWKAKEKLTPSALTALAHLYLPASPSQAATLLESALRLSPDDPTVLLPLVQAYLLFDPAKARAAEAKLPAQGLEREAEKVDAEGIEGSVGVGKGRKQRDAAAGEPLKIKKKRKRVKRWPKGFSTENPPTTAPDPDRWLPKAQRASFQKKGRKGKQLFRGPQGAAVAGGGLGGTRSANIAGVAGAGGQKLEPRALSPPPAAETPPSPAGSASKPGSAAPGSGKAQSSKKKKGGKTKF